MVDLPVPATMCKTAVAEDAGFVRGIGHPRGNTSSGAAMWEEPEPQNGTFATIIEEVAARGTLSSIGISLGFGEDRALEAGKTALVDAVKTRTGVNDNKKIIETRKIVVAHNVHL
jgi:hypothetical protein